MAFTSIAPGTTSAAARAKTMIDGNVEIQNVAGSPAKE